MRSRNFMDRRRSAERVRLKRQRDRTEQENAKLLVTAHAEVARAVDRMTTQLRNSGEEQLKGAKNRHIREIVTLGIGFCVALVAYCQWRTMNRQLQSMTAQQLIMQGQLDESQQAQRPIISAEIGIAGAFVGDDAGIHLPVTAAVKNTGLSPAVGLEYDVELYVEEISSLPRDELQRFCNEVIARRTHDEALPTNDEISQQRMLSLAPPNSKVMNVHVLICVAYRSLRTKDNYFTGSVYKLIGDTPAILFPGTIAADHLRLISQPQLGSIVIH
jgi:hypothetical protein